LADPSEFLGHHRRETGHACPPFGPHHSGP
jgi:hypothetical protein